MNSSVVVAGNDIKASEYNNLRLDMPAVGIVVMWGTITPPTGWLLCAGAAVNRTTYSDLFAIIGTTFGVGDGSTTFNLPDMQENFIIGKSVTYTIGDTGGGTTTLVEANMPAHTHTITAETDHQHTKDGYPAGAGLSSSLQASNTAGPTQTSQSDGDHNHTGATGSEGSDTAITILPPHLAVNYIIRY